MAREQADPGSATFWTRVAEADLALAEALFHDRLPADLDTVIERYGSAFAHSSSSQRESVLEHIEMIEAALPEESGEVERRSPGCAAGCRTGGRTRGPLTRGKQ